MAPGQRGRSKRGRVNFTRPSISTSSQPHTTILGISTSSQSHTTRLSISTSSRPPSSSTVEPDVAESSHIRGPTRGKSTIKKAKVAPGGKLSVTFNADCRQPVCVNAERFNNEIGFIVRTHGTFHYKEWRLVPEAVRAPLREFILDNFDVDLLDATTRKCIDEQMRKAWKGHKYKLHTYFKEIGGEENVEIAKRKRHPDLNDDQQKDWEMLCDYWSSDKFQEWSAKNTEHRSKRKWGLRNGSVSIARHHIRRGALLTDVSGQIEAWRDRHFNPENGWLSPDLQGIYDQMMIMRAKHPPQVLSDKEIIERVLGRQSVRLRGWGRSPSGSITSETDSGQPRRPTYAQLVEELNSTREQINNLMEGLDECRQVLREHNLMPPPRSHTPISDQNSGPSMHNPAPRSHLSDSHDESPSQF